MDETKIKKVTTLSMSTIQNMYMQSMTIQQARKFLDAPFQYVTEEEDGTRLVRDEWWAHRYPKKAVKMRDMHRKQCREMHAMIIENEASMRKTLVTLHEVVRALHGHIFNESAPKLVQVDEVTKDLKG